MPIQVLNATGALTTIATIDDLIALFGEGASPAANTLQARIDQLKGFTDGVEALITSTNAALATLNAQTDGVEALLTALGGYVDGLEALAGAATPTGANVIGKVDHTTSGLGHGVKTVTAAGTAVALAASTVAKWVTVQAQTDNTGIVAVGGAGVVATVATGTGVALAAGESITIPVDNLADVFIDATVTSDGVRFIYGT